VIAGELPDSPPPHKPPTPTPQVQLGAARQDITANEFWYNHKALTRRAGYRPPREVHAEHQKLRIAAVKSTADTSGGNARPLNVNSYSAPARRWARLGLITRRQRAYACQATSPPASTATNTHG